MIIWTRIVANIPKIIPVVRVVMSVANKVVTKIWPVLFLSYKYATSFWVQPICISIN